MATGVAVFGLLVGLVATMHTMALTSIIASRVVRLVGEPEVAIMVDTMVADMEDIDNV
jgi:uncharacterized membrane protein YdjX (TVP38/TMEM64 family)